MLNEELPPELRHVEDALRSRPGPDAGEAKARVLGAVRREVQAKAIRKPMSFWRFAAAAAAVVLLWLNLSMSAVNDTQFALERHERQADDRVALAQLRELLPDCSEADARRHLLMLRAGSQLVSAPAVRGARVDASPDL